MVNTSSIAATAGLPQRALYSASKGAVLSLTRAMAADHLREGIRVNCVCPGTADTPWVGRLLEKAADPAAERAALNARQPHGRLVTPEEVADAVAYLASPRSGSTTGVALAATLAVLAFQLVANPRPGAEDRQMPAAAADYAGRVPSARGDVMVLGNAVSQVVREPAIADDLLMGASWRLDPHDVQNGYTTINFLAFRDRFCRAFNGTTCGKALARVLETEPTSRLDAVPVSRS